MNEQMTVSGYSGVDRRELRVTPPSLRLRIPLRRCDDKTSARHSAITQQLPDWRTYRTWAHEARGSWENNK